ncbi:hypothetical protein PRVXT_002006 [Proteinivorax tanatarense]|uniref:Uncharacterized protein n=1 Tax=Proteinivorax tanatarense TaxID=1260629 RepID=A0AAU7VIZ3_9FIRM
MTKGYFKTLGVIAMIIVALLYYPRVSTDYIGGYFAIVWYFVAVLSLVASFKQMSKEEQQSEEESRTFKQNRASYERDRGYKVRG